MLGHACILNECDPISRPHSSISLVYEMHCDWKQGGAQDHSCRIFSVIGLSLGFHRSENRVPVTSKG